MINPSIVTTDKTSFDSFVSEFNGVISGIGSYWNGVSYGAISKQFEDFITDYANNISMQLDYFNQAILLFNNYNEADRVLRVANTNLQEAINANDVASENMANRDIKRYSSDKMSYKNQIEDILVKVCNIRLEAIPMEYSTSVLANLSSLSSSTNITPSSTSYSDLDMSNYPTGNSFEDGFARSVMVAKYLVEHGGFTKEQAAALAGVYLDENNCDPGEVMEAERDGWGASGTGGDAYGAGVASWTFDKNDSLAAAGLPAGTQIENLTFQQQCDLIIAESKNSSQSLYYNALKRCETIEDASATAVVMIGAPGYCSNWETGHATPAQAKAMSDWYGASNDANYGASSYHWNLDTRRLDYAKQIYSQL